MRRWAISGMGSASGAERASAVHALAERERELEARADPLGRAADELGRSTHVVLAETSPDGDGVSGQNIPGTPHGKMLRAREETVRLWLELPPGERAFIDEEIDEGLDLFTFSFARGAHALVFGRRGGAAGGAARRPGGGVRAACATARNVAAVSLASGLIPCGSASTRAG